MGENALNQAPANKREMKRERTRLQLREAGAREFARRGVGATSIDTITSAAGFTRGAFYANYEGKHDLLEEILETANQVEIDAWRETILGGDSLDEILTVIARRFDNYIRQRDWAIVNVEVQIESKRNPVFRARVRKRTERMLQEIAELIGILARKSDAPNLDVESIVLTLRSLTTGLVLNAHEENKRSVGDLLAGYLRVALGIK